MKFTSEELRKLDSEINEHVPKTRNSYGCVKAKRNLTDQEWQRLLETIEGNDCVMVLCNTDYGFSMGFMLYQAPNFPSMPPEFLILVSQTQIPIPELQEPTKGFCTAAYDMLYPLASTEKNLQALKFCGFEMPRQASYYDY